MNEESNEPNSHEPRTMVNPKDGLTLIYIPGGEFEMGHTQFGIERPPHRVRLSPYWLGQVEVTNAAFRRFVDETGYAPASYDGDDGYNADDQPVVGVDYAAAVAYCEWAGGRLPTEAEWEFAARGTDGRLYPWGNEPPKPDRAAYGKTRSDTATTQPVGSKPGDRSPFGILDMAGNVLEWCADWAAPYPKDGELRVNPTGPAEGTERIMRGSCFRYHAVTLRAPQRLYTLPDQRRNYAGFRLAMSAE